MVAPLLATSAAGHWLAWPWKRSGGGAGWWLRSLRRLLIRCPRGTLPLQPTPELLQGFDTATQITAFAHWLRRQPSPALPLAARAFALARPICLPPAPVSVASFYAMPFALPFGAPLGAPAPGWLPKLFPASGLIGGGVRGVGRRPPESGSGVVPAAGREGSVGLRVSRWRWPQALPGRRTLAVIRAQRPANPR